MPETFNGFYEVIDLGGGAFQITGAYNPSSSTFSDTSDGTNDGSVAIGDQVTVTAGASFPEPLTGIVPGAGLISFSDKFLYTTNDASLNIGDVVNIDQTAPYTFCFLEGTLVSTPNGEIAVEKLRSGDQILTASGKTVPVKWMGHQTIHNNIFTSPARAPVCISAGALGDGLPHSDLFLTAEHGMILDGLVINAGAMINGETIRAVPMAEMPKVFVYYHVETEDHDVILANGAPAETFIDYNERRSFDNYDEYLTLFGEERPIQEMNMPRVSAARLLPPAIKARLNTRAAA